MSAKWDRRWTRIGRYDRCRRRSTWARIEYGSDSEEGVATAVEMRSGREGDDAFVRVERGDPSFDALLNVLQYSVTNVDSKPDPDEQIDND
jgi:hypothetical protein